MNLQNKLSPLRRLFLSGQLVNWFSEAKNFLPWISLLAGLGGSLHCVGMCGGLVTATCEKSHDVFRYQIGRLLGYLCLGLIAGLLGEVLNLRDLPPALGVLPALFIGILFIFWGIQNFRGKKAEFPAPKVFGRIYTSLWLKFVKGNQNFTKAFFTGLLSIFLPCGLLYGVVLGTLALQHVSMVLLSMFFFWLGTVPSMVVAPELVQRLIRPFKSKLPKTYAISLILIGLVTISFRMIKFYDNSHVHEHVSSEKSCH